MKSTVKLFLLIMVFAVPAFGQDVTILYSGAGQRGVSETFRTGKSIIKGYTMSGKAASMMVGDGLTAKVCANKPDPRRLRRSTEECVTFPEGKYDFHELKNRVESITVTRPVPPQNSAVYFSIYTGKNYTGIAYDWTEFDTIRRRGAHQAAFDMTLPVVSGPLDGNPSPKWQETISSIQFRYDGHNLPFYAVLCPRTPGGFPCDYFQNTYGRSCDDLGQVNNHIYRLYVGDIVPVSGPPGTACHSFYADRFGLLLPSEWEAPDTSGPIEGLQR